MDFDTANITAAKIHALTGWHSPEFMPDEDWPGTAFQASLDNIKASLTSMCANQFSLVAPNKLP
jgi:hypothetical protein